MKIKFKDRMTNLALLWSILLLVAKSLGQAGGSQVRLLRPTFRPLSLPVLPCSISLESSQIAQVRAESDFIQSIQSNPDLLHSEVSQRPVVTLTQGQERQLLQRYPQLFKQQAVTLPVISPVIPPVIARHRRDLPGRVCAPRQGSQPLILARQANGQVVQLAQLTNSNQWIMEETCSAVSDGGMNCDLAEREIPALFINLSGILANGGTNADFDMAYVVVHCCVAVSS
ncbi:uncharacterized protein LOC119719116 [Patiria miniata]|uniref:Uncharacterized protein n=1 Tax=Patiria miniata TaxID=46514 RepID=A0A913YXU7_PATMI|nr:uncharacterized protein LOC119719116 [Patiria miniata]